MERERVLLVEDEKTGRAVIGLALQDAQFIVDMPENVDGVRACIADPETEYAVAVLDMRLDDWLDNKTLGLTGASLGVELLEAQVFKPPECVIISAYPKADYYRAAIELGVADYLDKNRIDDDTLTRHVRALALRRALRVPDEAMEEWIVNATQRSRNAAGVIMKFCLEMLEPQLRRILGNSFVLLVSQPEETNCINGASGKIEETNASFELLQELVYGVADYTNPFVFDSSKLQFDLRQYDAALLRTFDGTSFVPLTSGQGTQVSLGIRAVSPTGAAGEDGEALARVLARHWRPPIFERVSRVLHMCSEVKARRDAVLVAMSQACLNIGEEQSALLECLSDANGGGKNTARIERARALAADLRDVGELLANLGPKGAANEGSDEVTVEVTEVPLPNYVRTAWVDLCETMPVEDSLLNAEGECSAEANAEDVFFAITKLLQWCAQRALDAESEARPAISVRCETEGPVAKVVIEDRGGRLADPVREQLFMPFAQPLPDLARQAGRKSDRPGAHMPLYLARMLVELRNNGTLEDRTSDLERDDGHRFVLTLPAYSSDKRGGE